MRKLPALVIVTALAVGCSAAHEPLEVGSGIYDLTVRGEVDRCSPARATGAMGRVGVVSASGLVNLAAPETSSVSLGRVSLSARDGFHTEAEIAIPGCEGATLRRAWTIVDSRGGDFAVALTEEWSGVGGCAAAREAMPGAPDADCRADRLLDYRLMEPCAAPCAVHIGAGDAICACD